jgi:exopolysaccharide/PEP-CTERM locus tyrosine autokinase
MGKFYDALKKSQQEGKPWTAPPPRSEPRSEPVEPAPPLSAEPPQAEPMPVEPALTPPPPRMKPEPAVWSPLEEIATSGPPTGSRHSHLLISNGTDPAIVEQYKMLRTYVLQHRNGNPPRTILVTSTLQGEGKSTVAANLAIAIARSVKEHVLLIDCDLREPSLHRVFGLRPSQGLADYLRRPGVDLSGLLLRTEVEKLSFLPAGPKAADASELLASERMRSLMAEVRSRYDDRYIILDSTPLLPTTDPSILAKQVDAILLVVRAGMASRDMVARQLEAVGRDKLLGVVLNGITPSPASYAYKYYYRSAYRTRRD